MFNWIEEREIVNRLMIRMGHVHTHRRFSLLALVIFSLAASPYSAQRSYAQDSLFDSTKLVPFVPSPQSIVDKMIELAEVQKGDLVYDLGSGDGRIVIAAANKGAQAVGFEIDGDLVKTSRDNIQGAGIQERAEIRQQDILSVDVSPASVVALYLLPDVNLKLKPRLLRQLRTGSRIVSHSFDMGDWIPDKTASVDGHTVYLWIVPPQVR